MRDSEGKPENADGGGRARPAPDSATLGLAFLPPYCQSFLSLLCSQNTENVPGSVPRIFRHVDDDAPLG